MHSKKYFDAVAGQWDAMRAGFFSESVRMKAFAVAGLQTGQVAADLGAGTGFITEGLIREGLHVIAVDQSEAMLAQMQKKFAGAKGITYRVGQATQLPVENDRVDFVFANMYLHHVEEPAAAIAEMYRILKPGGMVIITDLDEHTMEFLRTEQNDYWLGFPRQNILDWLQAAGFKNAEVNCLDENCCAQSECGGDAAEISIFIATGIK